MGETPSSGLRKPMQIASFYRVLFGLSLFAMAVSVLVEETLVDPISLPSR